MTSHVESKIGNDVEPDGSFSADFLSDRVVNADQAFLVFLFTKYRGSLYQHLHKLVFSTEDASDLVQESYFRLLRHGGLVKVERLARAYLFETATNLAHDHMRSRVRQQTSQHIPLEECDLENACGYGDPYSQAVHTQMLARLSGAILALPKTTRSIFLLSRFRSMTYTEISKALGVSIRSVERKMGEALGALAAVLGAER